MKNLAKVSKINVEQAWELLFNRHDIVSEVQSEGCFRISSAEINTVKEARLMAKFDQSFQLPEVFLRNKLSILPVTRGEYIIGPFSTHREVTYSDVRPEPVEVPNLQTLDYTNLYSEASALLFAYNSGIIQDIMGSSKVNFTVNGRMSSGNFEYNIDNVLIPLQPQVISVQNAQVEIDAGYESSEAFCICEAKNIAVEEVLIRQLYYPYRLWRSKISKPIIPMLLVFSNDIFHTFIYQFEDEKYYNSLKLLKHKAYTFADEIITLDDVIALWKSIVPQPEPNITFPQADSFGRVVDLLSVLFESSLTRDEVTFKYEFDARQTNYYISACEYLGLIHRKTNEEGEREYQLSSEAQHIMNLRYKQKYLAIIKKVLERPVFYQSFELALKTYESPNKKDICQIMEQCKFGLSQITLERRAATVRSWLDWILRMAIVE